MSKAGTFLAALGLILLPTPVLADLPEAPPEDVAVSADDVAQPAAPEPAPPAAAKQADFGRPGWYLGVGGAAGVNFFEDEIQDALARVGLDGKVRTTAGINARVGYRFASWFALEGMYEWMPRFRVDATFDDPGGPEVVLGAALFDYTTHTATLNLKFVVPTWRFQPYLLLGIGGQYFVADAGASIQGTTLDLSDRGWAIAGRPGVGLDIYLTENLVLNAELDGVLATADPSTIPNIGDMFYISVGGGLQWRF